MDYEYSAGVMIELCVNAEAGISVRQLAITFQKRSVFLSFFMLMFVSEHLSVLFLILELFL